MSEHSPWLVKDVGWDGGMAGLTAPRSQQSSRRFSWSRVWKSWTLTPALLFPLLGWMPTPRSKLWQRLFTISQYLSPSTKLLKIKRTSGISGESGSKTSSGTCSLSGSDVSRSQEVCLCREGACCRPPPLYSHPLAWNVGMVVSHLGPPEQGHLTGNDRAPRWTDPASLTTIWGRRKLLPCLNHC